MHLRSVLLAAVRHKVVWRHVAAVAVPTLGGHTDLPHFRRGLSEAAWRTVAPFSCSRTGRERK